MEGVMMRGATSMAMAVRTEDGDILTETRRLKGKRWYSRVPILRGCVAFVSSLISGTETLLKSSEVIYPEEETPSKGAYLFSAILGVLLAVGLFILLPSFIASLIFPETAGMTVLWYSLIEGGTRILIFILYLVLVSMLKDIRRTFMYHGAEHRTINCYEKGLPLTADNVQTCSTRHNRCGTTFLFFVMVVSILVFSLITWLLSLLGWTDISALARMGIRLLFLPIVAGLSYELLRFLAILPDNAFVNIFRAPGLALQRLTTYPPEKDMAEVAIVAFNLVLEMDANPTIQPHAFGEFTMSELKNLVKTRLEKAGIEEDAETDWLICAALKVKRGALSSIEKTTLAQYRKVTELLRKRESGIPLDYITGFSEFYGIRLEVNESVLIPRIDTEFVADEVIKYAKTLENPTVLDLMTGSGCIALAIKKNVNAVVTASDLSDEALVVASKNLKGQATIIKSDCFESIEGVFDIIVSNPPYIKTAVIETLDKAVTVQPLTALDGGEDGLDFYRRIAKDAPAHLSDEGKLFLEIGYDQADEVSELLKESFEEIEVKKDYGGNDRLIIATKR